MLLSHYANISYRLGGEKLVIDSKTEEIVGNDKAMAPFKRDYRKPYVIEDNVSGAATGPILPMHNPHRSSPWQHRRLKLRCNRCLRQDRLGRYR